MAHLDLKITNKQSEHWTIICELIVLLENQNSLCYWCNFFSFTKLKNKQ